MDNTIIENLQAARQKNITEQYEIQDRLNQFATEQSPLKSRQQFLQNEEQQLKGALFILNQLAEKEKAEAEAAAPASDTPSVKPQG